MATNNNIPNSVDYTSRDFFSLRDDLKQRVSDSTGGRWQGTDPADFGVALVEAFAHVGDVTNYYIDRVANEAYLATATQRQNVLSLAAMYGYKPAGYKQAYLTLTFSNPTSADISVPAGSVFSVTIVSQTAQSQSIIEEMFTLTEDVIVPAAVGSTKGSATGFATHGRLASSLEANQANPSDSTDISGELLGSSNGYGSQIFTLKYPQVVDDTVQVFVKVGNQYVPWTQVNNLAEYGPTDSVYAVYLDADNYVHVLFGDGVTGAIPVSGDLIKVDYIIGGGLEGNIDGGQKFYAVYVPVASGQTLSDIASIEVNTVSNMSGFGGDDPESINSIRANATSALKASARAVSLDDFKQLALSVSGVGKSASYATSPNAVNVYVSPSVSDTSSDYFPGYKPDNSTVLDSWYLLQSNVLNTFSGKTQIGCSVTVLPPTYVPVDIAVEYVKDPQYTDAQVINALNYGIIFGLGYNYLDYDMVIRPEKIEKSLGNLPGIDSVKVIKLARHGGSGVNTLSAAQGEYFVFQDVNTKIYPVASLSALTFNGGYSVNFKPSTYTYNLTVTGTSITVTPTVARTLSGSASTVKVNGTTVTSGSASGSISTPSGTSTITITVTSYDSVHTQTYTVKVKK